MRVQLLTIIAVLLAVAGAGQVAEARTITVAKDGSGEFSVIQDALDAAQPGDAIEIGPGHYDEVRYTQLPLGPWYVAMRPAVPDVLIRGAGPTETIIGFQVPTPSIDGVPTGGLGIPDGVVGCRVEGISMQHMKQLVNLVESANFSGCKFSGATEFAVALLDVDGASFTGCSFEGEEASNADFVIGFSGGQNPNTRFTDCSFTGGTGTAVSLTGASNAVVEGCRFSGMYVGVVLYGAIAGAVRDCTFDGMRRASLIIEAGSDVLLERCILGGASGAAGATLQVAGPAAKLVGVQNRLYGSPRRTLYTLGGVDIQLREGDILNGGGLTVEALSPALYTPRIDLRNNYWGTTDLAQIAAWIQDRNDAPPPGCWYCPAAVVQYEPILNGTVPAEEESFGSLKARFGGHRQ